jgi:methanogenic corrinoid protein MtbC1
MEELKAAIKAGIAADVVARVDSLLKEGRSPQSILDVMIDAVHEVGEAFSRGEAFIPEMLIAAKAMEEGADHMAPLLQKAGPQRVGKFMIATVLGDMHDVGKNLVALVLKGNGFDVVDLGVDVPVDKLIDGYEKEKPDIVGLSALLTTTMDAMVEAVRALKTKHPEARIMVGGAPLNQDFADRIGADGYAPDAGKAVEAAKGLLGR